MRIYLHSDQNGAVSVRLDSGTVSSRFALDREATERPQEVSVAGPTRPDEEPLPPGKPPNKPVKPPPGPRPPGTPEPTPIDDPQPPKPRRLPL